jgi:hypothetical protein
VTTPQPAPDPRPIGPDEPVPYALTAKAHAALSEPAPAAESWACRGCGDAFFGTPPQHGLCPRCLASDSARQEGLTP